VVRKNLRCETAAKRGKVQAMRDSRAKRRVEKAEQVGDLMRGRMLCSLLGHTSSI
jgi:hypothetical protein